MATELIELGRVRPMDISQFETGIQYADTVGRWVGPSAKRKRNRGCKKGERRARYSLLRKGRGQKSAHRLVQDQCITVDRYGNVIDTTFQGPKRRVSVKKSRRRATKKARPKKKAAKKTRRSAKKTARKDPRRVAAGKKAAATRAKKKRARQAAAKKAARTRAAKKSPAKKKAPRKATSRKTTKKKKTTTKRDSKGRYVSKKKSTKKKRAPRKKARFSRGPRTPRKKESEVVRVDVERFYPPATRRSRSDFPAMRRKKPKQLQGTGRKRKRRLSGPGKKKRRLSGTKRRRTRRRLGSTRRLGQTPRQLQNNVIGAIASTFLTTFASSFGERLATNQGMRSETGKALGIGAVLAGSWVGYQRSSGNARDFWFGAALGTLPQLVELLADGIAKDMANAISPSVSGVPRYLGKNYGYDAGRDNAPFYEYRHTTGPQTVVAGLGQTYGYRNEQARMALAQFAAR